MPNPHGNADALVPAPKGNTRGLQHGAYSKRILGERAQAIASGLMSLEAVEDAARALLLEVAPADEHGLYLLVPALAMGRLREALSA
jgi:hypothetical protein